MSLVDYSLPVQLFPYRDSMKKLQIRTGGTNTIPNPIPSITDGIMKVIAVIGILFTCN